ncbi:unnamed protein product [Gadus morhua 'NCC']
MRRGCCGSDQEVTEPVSSRRFRRDSRVIQLLMRGFLQSSFPVPVPLILTLCVYRAVRSGPYEIYRPTALLSEIHPGGLSLRTVTPRTGWFSCTTVKAFQAVPAAPPLSCTMTSGPARRWPAHHKQQPPFPETRNQALIQISGRPASSPPLPSPASGRPAAEQNQD